MILKPYKNNKQSKPCRRPSHDPKFQSSDVRLGKAGLILPLCVLGSMAKLHEFPNFWPEKMVVIENLKDDSTSTSSSVQIVHIVTI